GAIRAVSHHHQAPGRFVFFTITPVRTQKRYEVFFRREPPDVQEIVIGKSSLNPCRRSLSPQRVTAPRKILIIDHIVTIPAAFCLEAEVDGVVGMRLTANHGRVYMTPYPHPFYGFPPAAALEIPSGGFRAQDDATPVAPGPLGRSPHRQIAVSRNHDHFRLK